VSSASRLFSFGEVQMESNALDKEKYAQLIHAGSVALRSAAGWTLGPPTPGLKQSFELHEWSRLLPEEQEFRRQQVEVIERARAMATTVPVEAPTPATAEPEPAAPAKQVVKVDDLTFSINAHGRLVCHREGIARPSHPTVLTAPDGTQRLLVSKSDIAAYLGIPKGQVFKAQADLNGHTMTDATWADVEGQVPLWRPEQRQGLPYENDVCAPEARHAD